MSQAVIGHIECRISGIYYSDFGVEVKIADWKDTEIDPATYLSETTADA